MVSVRVPFGLYVMVLSLCYVSMASRAQEAPAQSLAQAAPPQPDSLPLTRLPGGPVIVDYQNGQLMIVAKNATLGSVLLAACNLTGTSVEIPSDADERVAGVFGPAPARDVFALL